MADFESFLSQINRASSLASLGAFGVTRLGGTFIMQHRWFGSLGLAVLVCAPHSVPVVAQIERGPFARIAIMRAIDGHSVEWEEGYIRHLEWHRRVKDPFKWYSYLVWASTERQRWIVYATFGHAASSLSNPILPADDERDNLLNVLPHAQFLGNWIYEYLPALSRSNSHGVPTPTARTEYTTVELTQGSGQAFEAAIAAEQSKLQGETLWYRMVVGGDGPRYVRLRPRASLAAILDERADQALPDTVNGLVSKITFEALNLRPNMLVNVTPEPIR
jgi:hypothetical protein